MSKVITTLVVSTFQAVCALAVVIGLILAARLLGDLTSLPYLTFGVVVVTAIFLLNTLVKTLPEVFVFNPQMQPADMRQLGLTMLAFFALLHFYPNQYTALNPLPWPLSQSVINVFREVSLEVPRFLGFAVYLTFYAFGLTGCLYLIVGTGISIANKMGVIDMTPFDLPDQPETPSLYDLQQKIRALETDLNIAEAKADDAIAEQTRMTRDLHNTKANEQAMRQELISKATNVSVMQKELAQTETQLREQITQNEELQASIRDLETIITDLRTRLHSQNAGQSPKAKNTKPAAKLNELIDKEGQ